MKPSSDGGLSFFLFQGYSQFMLTRYAMMVLLTLMASVANADPPAAYLVGVKVYLTTTTVSYPDTLSTSTVHGITQTRWSQGVRLSYSLPSRILEGYVGTSSYDPNEDAGKVMDSANLDNMGRISFCPSAGLIQTQYPMKILVYGEHVGCPWLEKKSIQKIERWKGPYDGFSEYGQPMFMEPSKAKLLSTRPVFSCLEIYTEMPMYWVSYNPKLGMEELAKICNAKQQPDDAEIDRLVEQGMFSVIVPAD